MVFFDLFEETIEYPKNVAENGVPNNILYKYVGVSFLNGLINYTDPFFVCVLEHYRNWEKEKINFREWQRIGSTINTNYNEICDDILLLAETKNCYWFFWSDQDCSDCMIGRFDKKDYTRDYLIEFLIKDIRDANDSEVYNYCRLPLPQKWITF